MFILGHVGLTIGIVLVGLILLKKTELLTKLDFRIIAIFAILPDILDKIIGHVIFHGTLNNGRLFSHTLVFLGIFSLLFYLVVRANWWVFVLPVATHHLFDLTWMVQKTALWPMYGWSFERLDIDVWDHWLSALTSDPYIFLSELVGFVIIFIVIYYFRIYKKQIFERLLKTGRLCELN